MPAEKIDYATLARRYCERQENTPADLLVTLNTQKADWRCDGWVLLECQDMSSSRMGSLVILAYGPNNTLKAIPDRPISPRGLASDMSTAVAYLEAADLPLTLPAELRDWTPPPRPTKPKKRRTR